MTERERLIELIDKASMQEAYDAAFSSIDDVIDMAKGKEYLANYLLENGVIVPPCKVGDTVYVANKKISNKVEELRVTQIETYQEEEFGEFVLYECQAEFITGKRKGDGAKFNNNSETVHFTKEEAEQALKGGDKE